MSTIPRPDKSAEITEPERTHFDPRDAATPGPAETACVFERRWAPGLYQPECDQYRERGTPPTFHTLPAGWTTFPAARANSLLARRVGRAGPRWTILRHWYDRAGRRYTSTIAYAAPTDAVDRIRAEIAADPVAAIPASRRRRARRLLPVVAPSTPRAHRRALLLQIARALPTGPQEPDAEITAARRAIAAYVATLTAVAIGLPVQRGLFEGAPTDRPLTPVEQRNVLAEWTIRPGGDGTR